MHGKPRARPGRPPALELWVREAAPDACRHCSRLTTRIADDGEKLCLVGSKLGFAVDGEGKSPMTLSAAPCAVEVAEEEVWVLLPAKAGS